MRRLILAAAVAGCLAASASSLHAADGNDSVVPTRTAVLQKSSDEFSVLQTQYPSSRYRSYRGSGYGYDRQYYRPRRYVPFYDNSYSTGGPYIRYTVPGPYAFGTTTYYGFAQPGGYRYHRNPYPVYPYRYGY